MVVYISNSLTKAGVDETRGGVLCYLSRANDTVIVINTWDCGRAIQQSYYGRADGSTWNGKNWCWNPVQGGSWKGVPSRVDSIEHASATQLVIETTPRNWSGGELCEDVHMTTTLTLLPDGSLHMNCVMKYSGHDVNPVKDQEIPACFFDSSYSTLVYRSKTTKNIVKTVPVGPSPSNKRWDADPTWAGYENPLTKRGVFLTCPSATELTAYRVENTAHPHLSNCSYLAPLVKRAIAPNSTTTYDVYFELAEAMW